MKSDEFDFEAFQDALYKASKAAFVGTQNARPNEAFYLFALYTCGDLGYFYPTASSEEGLTEVAQEYCATERYRVLGVEHMREDLRWSPCDSPLHLEGEEHFRAVNAMAARIAEMVHEIPTDDSWDQFDVFCDQVIDVCIRVLKRLDAEGVFGTGERREGIVLNVLMGDQSDEERLKYAELLNPASVYARFQDEYHA